MTGLDFVHGRAPPPQFAAVARVNRQRDELVARIRCQEDAVAPNHRGGMSGRNGRFPEQIGVRPEANRRFGLLGDAGGVWPAELRPGRRGANLADRK